MGEDLLRLSKVTKVFRDAEEAVEVLKNLDLEVRSKDTIAVVGPSGIGKSTLLHILGALDRPEEGELLLNDQNLLTLDGTALARVRNESMGFVFQFHHLLSEFTALENVMMPARIRGIAVKKAEKSARELLERVGLGHRLHHKASQISGGEQQRTALARALIMEPSFLLADEPTGNLDAENSERIHDLLLEIHRERGCALVVVTHNTSLAQKMKRQITLRHGRIADA
ncbi:ABC transporter ATP-binding protein [Desulfococcaceae bacterium OttesenSCG-928-F15]|nr:ABC transporter ATP-binding protein [Desulfococcaceae bacterium OttesenSCG-928-F15]